MGQKQAQTDAPPEAKKRRRVNFFSVDVGVEANDCINIFIVSRKEEVGVEEDSSRIEPIDLNQFFDNDGKIFGYQDLKINIFFSSISFHAYADITYQSTSDGGKGITDLKPALQKIFGESLVEKKHDFLQTFSKDVNYIRDAISNGEILHRESTKADDNKAERQVIRMAVNSTTVGELYCRLVPLALLLVDGSSPIDITDPSWEIYLAIESKDSHTKLLGFAALYRFYYYPDSSRLRISQILVLPTCQGQGHGRFLLETLNSIAVSENVYDLTIEEPSDYLQRVRTCLDIHRLLPFEPIKPAISSIISSLKQETPLKFTSKLQSDPPSSTIEDVRKSFKITKKQFVQCWEILIYLELDHEDSNSMEKYKTLIADRTKGDILGVDSGSTGKQIVDVPNDCDHEMTFVMFCPSDGVKVDESGEKREAQQEQLRHLVEEKMEAERKSTQEEQLKELVEERMEEIIAVAQKFLVK